MLTRIFLTLIVCGSVGFSPTLAGQDKSKLKQDFPLRISLLDESITPPGFLFVKYPYNPAAMVGTEFLLRKRPKHDLHLTGNLGFYFHRHIRTSVFLNTEIGYRYHLGRFSPTLRAGIGVAHAFSTAPVYVFNGEDYETGKNSGRPVLLPSVGFELAYRLKDQERSPELFFSYIFALEAPFAFVTLSHVLVGVGYKFYPF